ncbi:MAG: SH3 domain-containing protein [Polaribacter sp.]|uniref:SH3 domain-containing protein n=1 Tax=Polaribacter sp. TaxID=1920175 RepID=UPI002F35AC79
MKIIYISILLTIFSCNKKTEFFPLKTEESFSNNKRHQHIVVANSATNLDSLAHTIKRYSMSNIDLCKNDIRIFFYKETWDTPRDFKSNDDDCNFGSEYIGCHTDDIICVLESGANQKNKYFSFAFDPLKALDYWSFTVRKNRDSDWKQYPFEFSCGKKQKINKVTVTSPIAEFVADIAHNDTIANVLLNKRKLLKSGIIITAIDSLKYAKKNCCILSPKDGFTAYSAPNGKEIGKVKRIGNKETNNQFAYEIYFVSENQKIKLTDYSEIGYEIFAFNFTDSVNGFVKLKNQHLNIWFRLNEINHLGFKAVTWMDYMVLNSEKVLGYYAKKPGLRIRTKPNTTGKIIGSVKGELFEIKLTKNISGQWAKVMVTKYKEHPCNTELDEKANIEYKSEGWMKVIADNGTPNLWSYSRGC